MTIPLSAEQAAELKRLHAGKHYPEMYGYLGEVVSAEAASETDPGARAEHLRLITWLGTAKLRSAPTRSLGPRTVCEPPNTDHGRSHQCVRCRSRTPSSLQYARDL